MSTLNKTYFKDGSRFEGLTRFAEITVGETECTVDPKLDTMSKIKKIPDDDKAKVGAMFTEVVADFVGRPVDCSEFVYGYRRYPTGNVLSQHCDKRNYDLKKLTLITNVSKIAADREIAVIVNVDQDLNEPWPFQFLDHVGDYHELDMGIGDMLLFEGTRYTKIQIYLRSCRPDML